jgi:3-phenylpropionate/trans-cinnamate dioxygenase ferredoxin reductase subunit
MIDESMAIVGAGQAGVQIAESLRQEGWTGAIVLIGDEPHGPYHRPPLSKKWLAEPGGTASLAIRGLPFLERKNIELKLGVTVAGIDRAARRLTFADGSTLGYRGLALATGSRARSLPPPDGDLTGVYTLRSIEDAERIGAHIRRCAQDNEPVVVIGGGFIGLEVAATARKLGAEAVVLEGLGRLMSRVTAPIVSDAFLRLHRAHGVQIVFDVKVTGLTGVDGHVRAVRTADGREYRAGCVVIGIGVQPDDRLAVAAGLACERGIIVDECSRTNDAHIVAAGDCTARRLDGQLLRLESVQNAVEQGKSAAAALLGRERPFRAAPWFWSDQYDCKLQMVGLSTGYDEVIARGDLDKPAFSAYYFRAARLIAVDSLSRPGDHLCARKLLDAGLSPTPAQVADPEFELNSLLKAQAATAAAVLE